MACCLPTCARGFSFSGTEVVEKGSFFGFWASPWCLVHPGVLVFLSLPPCVYKVWVSKMCPLLDTPCGRRSVGALSLLPLRGLLGSTKNCWSDLWWVCGFHEIKLYVLASVGRPSLHSYDACMVYWIQGASPRDCRQKHGKTSFSPRSFFFV